MENLFKTRLFFAFALTVVFALVLAVGCGEPLPDPPSTIQDNADWVAGEDTSRYFTIETDSFVRDAAAGGRAMFSELAHDYDYYEVVFKDSTGKYHHKAARVPNKIKISIPDGVYASGTSSVLLAGNYNGNHPILLAVGAIDNENVAIATNNVIDFTLYSLNTDVLASASFTLTSPVVDEPTLIDYEENAVPCWSVTSASEPLIKGRLITSATAALAGIKPTTSASSIVYPQANIYIAPKGYQPEGLPYVNGIEMSHFGTLSVAAGVGQDTNFPIDFEIPNPEGGVNGLFMLNFEAPVMGLDGEFIIDSTGKITSNTKGTVWYIRNGTKAHNLDLGSAEKSTGAGILIELGSVGIVPFVVGAH